MTSAARALRSIRVIIHVILLRLGVAKRARCVTTVCKMAQQQTILDEITSRTESALDRVTALTNKLSTEKERWSWDGAHQSRMLTA